MAKPVLLAVGAVLALLARGPVVLLLNLARLVPTKLGIALRWTVVRRLAKQCGDCVAIHKGVYLFGLEHAELGRNVSVHPMSTSTRPADS